MTVCFLTTGHGPDDDRVYYKELRSLLAACPDIHLAAPGTAEEWAKVDPRVKPVSLGTSRSVGGRLRAIPRAIRAMARLKPDVIHFQDLELLLAVPFLRLLTRARLVYDVHEMYPDQVAMSDRIPGWLKPAGRWFVWHTERLLARLCHRLITADQPVADSFSGTGVPTLVVYNYPRLELFRPDPERVARIRAERPGRTLLVYQGSMGIDRGLLQMVQAMATVRQSHPEALLLLVGNLRPALKARVESLVRELGVENQVETTGWVDHRDVVNWVAACQIGLVPFLPVEKYRKNIPVKQFEYMACGLPVIGADLPPIRRYLEPSGGGVLYPAGDLVALTRAMGALLDDPERRQALGRAGQAAVEARWNWAEMEKVLVGCYRGLGLSDPDPAGSPASPGDPRSAAG